MGFRSWLADRVIEILTRPVAHYERRDANDLEALKRHIRKGDVLLVEGDQRVSAIIKYLTRSSWSHAALYVGDELLRRGGELGEDAQARFGDQAGHLMMEALLDGVAVSPLAKYVDFNIRLCRPHNLRPDDVKRLMDEAVSTLGWRYDVRNIVDLMRYLLPVSLVPRRFRRRAERFGSGAPSAVICSSHLGRLFHGIGFPIAGSVTFPGGFQAPAPRRRSLTRRLLGRERRHHSGVYRRRHPTLLTPRDFDLSPYFEIIKFNVISDHSFDYHRIRWAVEEKAGAAGEPGEEPG